MTNDDTRDTRADKRATSASTDTSRKRGAEHRRSRSERRPNSEPAHPASTGPPTRATSNSPSSERRAGVLMAASSLPGPDGIGDIGASARAFVEWLASAGQRIWQLLPLNPPSGPSNSPYDALSAFAGNPLLISLPDLVELGLLEAAATRQRPELPTDRVDYARARAWKLPLLHQAAEALIARTDELHERYMQFCERESWWLADYVTFVTLRDAHGGSARDTWPTPDRVLQTGANRSSTLAIGATHAHPAAALQFLFYTQLEALATHAAHCGVELMGDVPIYVGGDSADVWAQPQLWMLDAAHQPTAVSGAAPDAFDRRGQIWGMPAYDWAAHRSSGYEW